MPADEFRAKDGNLSIPLYLGTDSASAQSIANNDARADALPAALSAWLESSSAVRQALDGLLESRK